MYLQNKRLLAQKKANDAAEDRKFRAPTSDVTQYTPHIIGGKYSGMCDETCNPRQKHNTFASKMISCNPSYTTG